VHLPLWHPGSDDAQVEDADTYAGLGAVGVRT
jgi:hypothetical protein